MFHTVFITVFAQIAIALRFGHSLWIEKIMSGLNGSQDICCEREEQVARRRISRHDFRAVLFRSLFHHQDGDQSG